MGRRNEEENKMASTMITLDVNIRDIEPIKSLLNDLYDALAGLVGASEKDALVAMRNSIQHMGSTEYQISMVRAIDVLIECKELETNAEEDS